MERVFWAVFGALAGIFWVLVQTFIFGNYDSRHLPNALFRVLFAPFYAVVFILLVQGFGMAASDIGGTPVEIRPPGTAETGTGIVIAFLVGLFTERFHERFRNMADVISKQKFLGGKKGDIK